MSRVLQRTAQLPHLVRLRAAAQRPLSASAAAVLAPAPAPGTSAARRLVARAARAAAASSAGSASSPIPRPPSRAAHALAGGPDAAASMAASAAPGVGKPHHHHHHHQQHLLTSADAPAVTTTASSPHAHSAHHGSGPTGSGTGSGGSNGNGSSSSGNASVHAKNTPAPAGILSDGFADGAAVPGMGGTDAATGFAFGPAHHHGGPHGSGIHGHAAYGYYSGPTGIAYANSPTAPLGARAMSTVAATAPPAVDDLPPIPESPAVHSEPEPATALADPFDLVLGAAARPKRPSADARVPAKPQAPEEDDVGCFNPASDRAAYQMSLPRPVDCGEDAFFTWSRGPYSVFGVADGVGGWADLGVDPSLFAWELMRNCRWAADRAADADAAKAPEPRGVLSAAYARLLEQRAVTAGSATAAVLSFDQRTGLLRTANLGDSGYLIVGDGGRGAVYRSPEQQHYFNAPFQLSVSPDGVRGNIADSPADAQVAEHQLHAGDVVIVATDGLFDNAFTSDIVYTVQRELTAHHPHWPATTSAGRDELAARVTRLARALAIQGREYAMNHRRQSPFARAASSLSGRVYSGGKLDDVTVVTAVVVDVASAPTGAGAEGGAGTAAGGKALLYARV
ncbi:Protein phosphatase 2C 7 [Blastocladiella emersonii ATCC 22665]|nr:Protein phosphatase 2C 7 [Blastocladiella emersonii ATCC 22665]